MVEINLTIDEIKAHLNLDHDLDDELLEAYKVSTLEVCQNILAKPLGKKKRKRPYLLPRQLRLVA